MLAQYLNGVDTRDLWTYRFTVPHIDLLHYAAYVVEKIRSVLPSPASASLTNLVSWEANVMRSIEAFLRST